MQENNKKGSKVSFIITIIILLIVGYFLFTIGRDYYYGLKFEKENANQDKEVVEEKEINLNSAAVVESMERINHFSSCGGYLPTIFYKDKEVKVTDITNDEAVAILYFYKSDSCGNVLTISTDETSEILKLIFGRDDFTILEANKNFNVTMDENKNYVITPNNCDLCSSELGTSEYYKATIAKNNLYVYENYNGVNYKWKLDKGRDGRYYFVSIAKI